MKNRGLPLALAILMGATFLGGCARPAPGADDGDSVPAASSDTQSGGAAAADAGEREFGTDEDGPFGAYAEPVTLTAVKGIHSTEANRFSELEQLTGETFYDNRWTRLFQKELGIRIEYLWVVDESQYQQKWKLALSSGEIPDVARVELSDMKNMDEAGLIWDDMAGYYERYATPELMQAIEDIGFGALDSVTLGRKMKALPYTRGNTDDMKYMFIRQDWLDAVGMEAPSTIDEMMDVMQAFVDKDPDGNGEKDTFAIAAENSLWYHFGPIFWAYGANPEYWVETAGGQLAHGRIQPEMKDALRKLQEMYQRGFMDPEFALKTEFQAKPTINANKIGIDFAGFWEVENLGPLKESVPTAEWAAYPLPGRDAETDVPVFINSGVTHGYVVKKDFAHPEALVKMLNLSLEMSMNQPHVYMDAEVPVVWPLTPIIAFDPRSSLKNFEAVNEVLEGRAEYAGLSPARQAIYDSLDSNEKNKVMYGLGDRSSLYQMKQVIEKDLLVGNKFYGLPTPTMIERHGALEELTQTAFIKIITDGEDVDATFEKFVSDWKAQGGDQITAEVNVWYGAGK